MNICYMTELFKPAWVRVSRMEMLMQKLGLSASRVNAVGKPQTALPLGRGLWTLCSWFRGLGGAGCTGKSHALSICHLTRQSKEQVKTSDIRAFSIFGGLFHWAPDKSLKVWNIRHYKSKVLEGYQIIVGNIPDLPVYSMGRGRKKYPVPIWVTVGPLYLVYC